MILTQGFIAMKVTTYVDSFCSEFILGLEKVSTDERPALLGFSAQAAIG